MTAADTVRDLPAPAKGCPECGARFGVEAAFCPFCGIALVASTWDKALDPLIGVIVDDRYEVIEPLGEGGMGTVYKVRHVTLNRMFALKVLRRDLADDPALSQRFIQEARATAAIKHPSVVSINDFGVLPDGIPYFVMELLVGETLSGRLRGRGPVPPGEAIAIAKRIAEGLSASHAANVIHRDLKPENVFLVGGSELRIVDFGAAKIIGASKLTRPGVVFGTPYYMSPEQASGQPIDARADVYSLGVLLFEMLTGRVPFEADTYMGVLTKHIFTAPPKPSERVAPGTMLGPLEAIVIRALEKDPAARYASMDELAKALDAAARSLPAPAPVPANRTVPLPRPAGGGVAPAPFSTADRIAQSVTKRVAERLDAIAHPLQSHLQDRGRDAHARPEQIRDLGRIGRRPRVDGLQIGQDRFDDRRLGRGKRLRRQIELMVADQTDAVRERARPGGGLGRGKERIPDRPGIDGATLEGGARIGRRQEHGFDRAVRHPRGSQRPDQQVMDVGALVQRDLLALQVGHADERRVLRHQDRLTPRCRRLVGDVEQRGAGGLGEDRRRLARGAEIDCADVERFEQLRSARKLGPDHLPALRTEPLLEQAALLEQDERAVFLDADPNHPVDREGRQGQAEAGCGEACQPHHIASSHLASSAGRAEEVSR